MRHLQISLEREQSAFLEQERRRLREEYGLSVSMTDLIKGLIELHRMRWSQLATLDPGAVPWFYKFLSEAQDDENGE